MLDFSVLHLKISLPVLVNWKLLLVVQLQVQCWMLDFPVLVLKLIKYSSIGKSESIVGVLNEIPMLVIGFTSAGS